MSNILTDAYYSLSRNINKQGGNKNATETLQGIIGEKLPELALDMSDEELLSLTRQWKKAWDTSDVKSKWDKQGQENEQYWLGKHFQRPETDKTRALVDNAIFEAVETYLPQALRRDPEPMVSVDEDEEKITDEARAFAKEMQDELGDIADDIRLRMKLKKVARHWAIYLLGAAKLGWDMNRDRPTLKVIRAQKLILDPNAPIDEDGYTGEYIGEYRKAQASILLSVIGEGEGAASAKKVIKDLVGDNLGTEVQFIEWWTDQYMCWTMNENVLLKKKNPHWNYDQEAPQTEEPVNPAEGQASAPVAPEMGMQEGQVPGMAPQPAPAPPQPVEGVNHFRVPKKPYLLFSIFNLGTKPVDDTSLIGQNLANQDVINKRIKQIDKNADTTNNGLVVSLERSGLTQQQAKGVATALRKGGVVAIPAGSAQDAVFRPATPGLPPEIYNQLQDIRMRVRDIFGTRGISPVGLENDSTVRGKIMSRGLDTDRIGGGISEFLEQFSDDIYNWFVQLLYVYDDDISQRVAQGMAIQGPPDPATGQPSQQNVEVPELNVSVKEGSLLPKDSTTIANQAIELAGGGKMSLIDLYKRLDYPNPEELAANVWLEVNAPELLFKDNPMVQQALQAKQQAAQGAQEKPPSESINFKDLPPDGKAQMAQKVGIVLHPEGIAAHAQLQDASKAPVIGPDIGGKPQDVNTLPR